jgi:hypothetical protein
VLPIAMAGGNRGRGGENGSTAPASQTMSIEGVESVDVTVLTLANNVVVEIK